MDGLVLTTNQKSLAAEVKPDIWDDPNALITIDPESEMGLALQQGLDQIAEGNVISITPEQIDEFHDKILNDILNNRV